MSTGRDVIVSRPEVDDVDDVDDVTTRVAHWTPRDHDVTVCIRH